MDSPNPVPAAMSACVAFGAGTPRLSVTTSDEPSDARLYAVASRSFSKTMCGVASCRASSAPSTVQGRLVALTRLSITGPATPKPAATIFAAPVSPVVPEISVRNSATIASNEGNLRLSYLRLAACRYSPLRPWYTARLHLVPPTSPAKIIYFSTVLLVWLPSLCPLESQRSAQEPFRSGRQPPDPPETSSSRCVAEPFAPGAGVLPSLEAQSREWRPYRSRRPEKRRVRPHPAQARSKSYA